MGRKKVQGYGRRMENRIHQEGKEKEKVMACWKGYSAKGMKLKGGRMVPNCVPNKSSGKSRKSKKK